MGLVFALVLLTSLGTLLTACGHASRSGDSASSGSSAAATTSSVTHPVVPSTGRLKGDEDDDDEGIANSGTVHSKYDNDADGDNDSEATQSKGYRDRDDRAVIAWGRAAGSRDRHSIATLVKRYYEIAAAGDGAAACRLTYVLFAEAIPEDYGQPPGPPELRGKTCAEVLTKLFRLEHNKLVADSASMRVTGVRVQGQQGRALVGFTTGPASSLQMHRERGLWRVVGPLATPLQ